MGGLENFEVYIIAKNLGDICRKLYNGLDRKLKKIIGDQFITAIDSIGANLAEGFGRYHYLDSNKFYYNARGSLYESKYRTNLLHTRNIIKIDDFDKINNILENLGLKLNNLIYSTKRLIKTKQ